MTTATATAVARLDIRGASKTFGARTVLRNVDLSVAPGEIHGVVGQNGSGKSTMAKIISGYHTPDAGTQVLVDGHPLRLPVRLTDLHHAGVSIVYQDLGLLPHRNVAANVRIGAVKGSLVARRIDWSREAAAAQVSLRRLGFTASMTTAIEDLAPADKARVAIARALQERQPGRGLLVFDESTRALPEDALQEFYRVVRSIAAEGTGVIVIGHRLSEILEHCDRVTVLRDGECVGSGLSTAELDEAQLAAVMLGRELSQLTFPAWNAPASTRVTISALQGAGLSEPLDLDLAPGEIVGLAGLPGSGYEAVPYLLAAARPACGEVQIDDDVIALSGASLAGLARRGVVLVPEDRLHEGLSAEHTVRENICLPWIGQRGRTWAIGQRWQKVLAQQVIQNLNVVPADDRVLVGRLSGGNQQKVLLGKWLSGDPRLLLLHEPTQAVDIKARHDILEAVHRVARQGTAVVLASSEAADLGLICDRILIFENGAVTQRIAGPCDPGHLLDSIYRRDPRHG